MNGDHFISWLQDIEEEDESDVGSKAAYLGELRSLSLNIPNGFAVTIHAYRLFLETNRLEKKIKENLGSLDSRDPTSLKTASERIKKLFLTSDVPLNIASKVIDAYFNLAGPLKDVPVAIRSSLVGTPQTLPDQATLLNVKGEANLVESLKECWASLYSPKNISLLKKEEHALACSVAVLIQRMVQSENSGVIITADAKMGGKNVILVEAVYGLGHLAAKGKVIPDRYFINKQNFSILEKQISNQKLALVSKRGLTKKIKIGRRQQNSQKIRDTEIIELAKIGKTVQDYYYFPQQIEWAIEKKKIFILQSQQINQQINRQINKVVLKPQKLTPKLPAKKRTIKSQRQYQQKKHPQATSQPIAKGKGISPGTATGYARVVKNRREALKIRPGEIFVTTMYRPDYQPAIKRAAAIVCEEIFFNQEIYQPPLSQLVSQLGIPWVTAVNLATSKIYDGLVITVNGNTGAIFQG